MATTHYQSFHDAHDHDEDGTHVQFQAEPKRSKWNHIIHLDAFFERVYIYHQKKGFLCILLQEVFELIQFTFVVLLTSYLVHGVDYDKLFIRDQHKTTLNEVILPFGVFLGNFGFATWLIMTIAFGVFAFKLIQSTYKINKFWDIRQFYKNALGIHDAHIENTTWNEVQTRLCKAQHEHQMCIHKKDLTELDIYHRILRQKNFMIALVNKGLLPPKLMIPFIGEQPFWTKTLCYNIEMLLFQTFFENTFSLREEYKIHNLREELAAQLGRRVLLLALANLILSPIIFLWQLLYNFLHYTEYFRRDPGMMAFRNWSMFGLLYLRHFNELDHELHHRLVKAHKAASRYVAAFSSSVSTLIAQHMGFIAGSLLAVFVVLTIYDEDVLAVEHVLIIMSLLGVIVASCKSMHPDETVSYDPEFLLSNVITHIHYFPCDWKGQAHTWRVRQQFENLFQYRIVSLLADLLSPLLIPIILCKHIYPKSLDFVDFFRNFTVTVVGVGDVCSFAQMDIRRHGNADWQYKNSYVAENQYCQAEDGKIEMSLVHFKKTNPSWEPPKVEMDFIRSVDQAVSLVSVENVIFEVDNRDAHTNTSMSQSIMYLHDMNLVKRSQPRAGEGTPLIFK